MIITSVVHFLTTLYIRYGGNFCMYFIGNFVLYLAVKECWTLVNIILVKLLQNSTAHVFEIRCIILLFDLWLRKINSISIAYRHLAPSVYADVISVFIVNRISYCVLETSSSKLAEMLWNENVIACPMCKVLSSGNLAQETLRSYGGLVVSWSRLVRNDVWFGEFISCQHDTVYCCSQAQWPPNCECLRNWFLAFR